MLVVLSATIMLVDLYAAECFCCNYAVRSFCNIMQVNVSATNMWVTIFIEILHMGVSAAIMQVVLSATHCAHDHFYCNYVGNCFCCSYISDSFKQQLYIPFSNLYPFFIKLTRKHQKVEGIIANLHFTTYVLKITYLVIQKRESRKELLTTKK